MQVLQCGKTKRKVKENVGVGAWRVASVDGGYARPHHVPAGGRVGAQPRPSADRVANTRAKRQQRHRVNTVCACVRAAVRAYHSCGNLPVIVTVPRTTDVPPTGPAEPPTKNTEFQSFTGCDYCFIYLSKKRDIKTGTIADKQDNFGASVLVLKYTFRYAILINLFLIIIRFK